MKVCWDCKAAVLNGSYCPSCHRPFTEVNTEWWWDKYGNNSEWTYATHEHELRKATAGSKEVRE